MLEFAKTKDNISVHSKQSINQSADQLKNENDILRAKLKRLEVFFKILIKGSLNIKNRCN